MCKQKEKSNYCWSSLKEICSGTVYTNTVYCWNEHCRVGCLVSGYEVTMLPTLQKQPAAKNAVRAKTDEIYRKHFGTFLQN